MADDRLEVTHLIGKKLDKPIMVTLSSKTENKMEQVAELFGKKLGERFTVERDHVRFDCRFMKRGFETFGVYENPYMDFDCFILEELLTGEAVIVND